MGIDLSTLPRDRLEELCRRWDIVELSLFGSGLTPEFGPTSDVDILVRFKPGIVVTLDVLHSVEMGLRQIFNRDVDVVDRDALLGSENYIRRDNILRSARRLYAA